MRPTRDLVFAEMACSTGPRLQPTAYFGHARSLPTQNLLYFDFAVVSRNVIRCALEGNWSLCSVVQQQHYFSKGLTGH